VYGWFVFRVYIAAVITAVLRRFIYNPPAHLYLSLSCPFFLLVCPTFFVIGLYTCLFHFFILFLNGVLRLCFIPLDFLEQKVGSNLDFIVGINIQMTGTFS